MNNASTIIKIELIPSRIKLIIAVFVAFLFIIGIFFCFLFFSRNTFTFIISTLLVFLSSLFVISCFYILKHVPDQSNHIPWKRLIFSIIGIDFLVLILAWFNKMLSSPALLLIFSFPSMFFFIGFIFAGTLIFPKKVVTLNSGTHELAYRCDYGTRIEKQSIVMTDVNYIALGAKREASISGGSNKVFFRLNKPVNTNNTTYALDTETREWILKTFDISRLFYELLEIFSKYPVEVVAYNKIMIRPLKNPLKKLIAPTQVNFSENSRSYFLKLLQHVSNNPLTDISSNNANLELFEKNSLLNNQPMTNPAQEIAGQYLFTSNKFLVGISIAIFLIFLSSSFLWLLEILSIFLKQNLLVYNFKFKSSPGNTELFIITITIIGEAGIVVWFMLLSLAGKEYFTFKNDMIFFSIKVFNKSLFTRKIPKRSIIAIEKSKKGLMLQLLGGDSFVYKINSVDEYASKLNMFKDLLLLNT